MGSSHHEALSEIAARLRADLPAMVDETEARLHREQPGLIAQVDAALLREAIGATHERFVAILEGVDDAGARHVAFASFVASAGIPVETLLTGYRAGAQVGWERMQRIVAETGASAEAAMTVATASLAYVDELSANSYEGFAREAAAAGGVRARERQALLAALVGGGGAATDALVAAAGWPLPERLCVAVLLAGAGTSSGGAGAVAGGTVGGASAAAHGVRGLDDDAVLLGSVDGAALAIVAEGDAAALLETGAALALGPPVAPPQAPLSLARARRVTALVAAGVLPGDRALRWEDHLPELVVHADGAAAEALAANRLAPLDGLPPQRRAMLAETLAAWLDHPGRPRELARVLHLHPQTVRYRLARLRERFGDALDDPRRRFELALALRVRTGSRDAGGTPGAARADSLSAAAPAPPRR